MEKYFVGGTRQNFQIKLYETINTIEFVYGTMHNPTNGSATIGINEGSFCMNRLVSIIPESTPVRSFTSSYNIINSASYLTNGLIYTFGPFALQNFSTFQNASICVGQSNWTDQVTTVDNIHTPGATSSAVSAKGVLAVGSKTVNRVMLWNSLPTTNGTAANIVVGQTNFSNSATNCTQALTSMVEYVTFSPDGSKLLVSDAGNNRILIWNTIPTSNGQNADVVVGQTDFTSNSSGITSSKLNRPIGILITPNGKMFVADYNNNRVLVYNSIPLTNGAAADLVIGQSDFTSNSSGTVANQLNGPWDMGISPDGKFLISDDNNNRVLIYNSIPTSNGASANYVIGQTGFGLNSSGVGASKLNLPGVTVSPEGKLAISDFNNNRVLIYNSIPNTNGASANIVLGQDDFNENYTFSTGSASGTADQRNMSLPYTANYDINGRLLVNGRDMNRVMIYGNIPSQVADLEAVFDRDNATPCVGNNVEYTLNIKNNGPDNATNVVVTSTLPAGFNLINNVISAGTYNPISGFWKIPAITNGQTASLTFIGTVSSSLQGKTVRAYANIVSYLQSDNNMSNNSDYKDISVGVSNAPTITSFSDYNINRNTPAGPLSFTVGDVETQPASLIVDAVSSNTNLVPNTNFSFGGSGSNRTITITPANNKTGTTIITVSVSDGTCTTTSKFTLKVGNLWKGTADNSWANASNWTGSIPNSTTEAIIPASPEGPNFPTITGNVTCYDIEVESGSFLTVNGTMNVYNNWVNNGSITNTGTVNFSGTTTISGTGSQNFNNVSISGTLTAPATMNVAGSWNNTGTFNYNNGTIIFNGTAAQQVISTESFYNIQINNSSGVTLNNPVTINGTLTLKSGTLTNGTNLTIANGASISKEGGTLTAAPTFGSAVNLIYTVSTTTGFEMPVSNTVLNNLTINGTAINVDLNRSATVNGTLFLTAGNINLQNYSLIIGNNTSDGNISGGSLSSYVIAYKNGVNTGKLVRHINNYANYNFPVGDATNFSPMSVQMLTGSYSAGSRLDVYVVAAKHPLLGSLPNYIKRYWCYEPTGIAAPYYNATFTYVDGDIVGDENHIYPLKYNSSGWVGCVLTTPDAAYQPIYTTGQGNTSVATNTLNWNYIVSFSEGTGAGGSGGSLPIDLIGFNAKLDNLYVNINWKTATETNNNYFTLERSSDAINFEQIAIINGAGNSNKIIDYSYKDNISDLIQNNNIYYRLKQTDYNGAYKHSKTIAVPVSINNNNIDFVNMYIDKTTNMLNLYFNSHVYNKSTDFIILDILGKVEYEKTLYIDDGLNYLSVPFIYKKGIYFIVLRNDKDYFIKKIINE